MQSASPDWPPKGAEPSGVASLRDRAIGLIAFAAVLALLYVGRDVLVPFIVALMLGLLIAPLIRILRHVGLSHGPSVLVAVVALSLVLGATAVALGTQVVRVAASLPQYEQTIRQKLHNLDEVTIGRLGALTSEAERLIEGHSVSSGPGRDSASGDLSVTSGTAAIPVEVREPLPSPWQIIARVLASVRGPAESTGIVLVVLVFVLLEHEALRDRFIRVVGGSNIRLTTLALNDACSRLSKFFVSQLAVNLGVGGAIALGLAALGVPEAALWGALATLLRFIPYVGVWLAAVPATALAIAMAPGWSLAVSTLGVFLVVELIAGQVVEPNLYGHTTGLSPLSVVVAAIFWGALWGPIGLVLSTPLTLCLLVTARHIRALSFLDLLLADTQALTPPQTFYERALSADADELLGTARSFLKSNSFAAYCDAVLIPALHLGFLDLAAGAISPEQHIKMRNVLVAVVSTLSGEPRRLRRRPPSVLDDENAGVILRRHREELIARLQGGAAPSSGSILLCVGLDSAADTIAAELLVRALREQRLDASHISIAELDARVGPPDASPHVAYLVSAFPSAEREHAAQTIDRLRRHLPGAQVVSVFLAGLSIPPELPPELAHADYAVGSISEAVKLHSERQLG